MRSLTAGGCLDVLGGCRPPSSRRRFAVEGCILVRIEEIQDRARHAGEASEVPDGGGRHVDPANAAEDGLHVAHASGATVEPAGTAAEACE